MLNILYTVDNNYAKYMIVSIFSLLEHNKDMKLNIYIIGDKLDKDTMNLLDKLFSAYSNANMIYVEANKVLNTIEKSGIPKWRGSHMANARLFFDEAIKDNVNDILYLDSDTIIKGSLNNIIQYNNNPVSGVIDVMDALHYKKVDKNIKYYVNSGVLLFSSKLWSNNNTQSKIINTANSKEMIFDFPDQDVLNKTLVNNIGILPLNYNLLTPTTSFSTNQLLKYAKLNKIENYYNREQINDAKKNPIIYHCTPVYDLRPWDGSNLHPYAKDYIEYFNRLFVDNKITLEEVKLYKKILLYLINDAKLYCPPKVKKVIKKVIKK